MRGQEQATGMGWRRWGFFGLLGVVAFLVVLNGYLIGRQVDGSGSEVQVFKQEVVELGGELRFGFMVVNNGRETVRYTFVIDSNSSEPIFAGLRNRQRDFIVPSGKSYEYVMQFSPSQTGVFQVRMTIYEGDEMALVDDVSFFVTVKEAS